MCGLEHVGQAPQRTVRRQRLDGDHIERGTGQLPPLQGRDQGHLIDHAAAANIHQHNARVHAFDRGGVDHSPGLLGQGQGEDDAVRYRQQIREEPRGPNLVHVGRVGPAVARQPDR